MPVLGAVPLLFHLWRASRGTDRPARLLFL
jgi:hypothetical protein